MQNRLLVTGASGWLGKSLISQLWMNRSLFSDVMLVGSVNRVLGIDNHTFNQMIWNLADVSRFSPTHIYHLAALTRDKLDSMSVDTYFNEYKKLNNLLSETLNINSIKNAIIVSSGAADLSKFPHNKSDPYSLAKNQEENLAREYISDDKNINILRVYSVTGRFINKIQKLAFSNLIYQAKHEKQLKVHAENLVFRQYIDAEELMKLSLNLFSLKDSRIYNSGGIRIEMHGLAKLIASYYDITSEKILLNQIRNKKVDDYTNELNLIPGLELNNISSLEDQISITSNAI